MKIFCIIPKYYGGVPESGLSFGYVNFIETFKALGHQLYHFDYISIEIENGSEEMNNLVLQEIEKEQPDIVFSMMHKQQINKKTLESIKNNNNTTSIGRMSDDQRRFDDYGKTFAGYFDRIFTTDPTAVEKYEKLGQMCYLASRGIKQSQLKTSSKKYKYDVSFVGAKNSRRQFIIQELESHGIHVSYFGWGRDTKKVSYDEMYTIFNTSKINLNLSNSVHYNTKYLFSGVRHFKGIMNVFRPLANIILSKKRVEQIKARFFEVLGSGGFLLSYTMSGLEDYFVVGQELITTESGNIKQLVSTIKYYLHHQEEREKIANAGYNKVKKRYTYEKVFEDAFYHIMQETSGK